MNEIKLSGLAKYGTLVTIAALLIVAGLSWFIKYPETIVSRSRLTGNNAPKPIITKINTRISELRKFDGDSIRKGEVIAILETTSDPHEVIFFSKLLDSIYLALERENYTDFKQMMNHRFIHLGELQADYQAFIQSYIPFRDYVLGDYVSKRKGLLGNDLNTIQKSKRVLDERREINNQDMNLSHITLEKNRKLLDEKLISEQEFRDLSSQNLGKQMSMPQMKSEYISNETQLNNIHKEVIELDNEVIKQKALFMQSTMALINKIEEWKKTYLLIASTDGKLAFSTFLQENQLVEPGRTIGYIIPQNSTIYLETFVPQLGFGKVDSGQQVLLRFDAYPWQEFGIVKGAISYISPIPADSGYYLAKVILPKGLQTNYNKVIPFKQGLLAQSEIVTKDLSLAENLYYSIIKQFRK